MITNFKIFESLNEDEPEVGDWVICELEDIDWVEGYEKMEKIISENIGKIIAFDYNDTSPYTVKYYLWGKNKEFFNNFITQLGYTHLSQKVYVEFSEIKYWSKNREDLSPEKLKFIIDTKKYNL